MRGICKRMYWLDEPSGFIYFIQMDRIGPIKIGFTTDIKNRLLQLQTANPYPLNLLLYYPGEIEDEKEIHAGFREMRLEGEWFLPHPFILKEIRLIKEYENGTKASITNNGDTRAKNIILHGKWSIANH